LENVKAVTQQKLAERNSNSHLTTE